MRILLPGLAAIGGSLCIAASAAADREPVKLRYTWPEGESIVYRTTQEMTGTTTMPGQAPMETATELVSVSTMHIQEGADDGAATVRVAMDAARMEMQPFGVIYDSQGPDARAKEHPLAQAYKAMVGESYTMVVTPQGEVRSVEGMDRILDRLADQLDAPMILDALKASMGDQAMRQAMELWLKMPAEAVEPGETWTTQAELMLPAIGTMKTDSTMTLEEIVEIDGRRMARIATSMTMSLDPEGAEVEGLPTGMKMSMEGATGEGQTLFDLERGRLHRMELVMHMPVEVELTDGEAQPRPIEQDITARTVMEVVEPGEDRPGAAPADEPGAEDLSD